MVWTMANLDCEDENLVKNLDGEIVEDSPVKTNANAPGGGI